MSHISEYIAQGGATPHRTHDITTAYECFTTAGKTGRMYRSTKKNMSRRVSYAADLIAGHEEEQNPEILSELCRTSWRVFRASPLWDVAYNDKDGNVVTDYIEDKDGLNVNQLKYDNATLKRYARAICGYVIKDQVDSSDMPNKVEMTQVKGLRGSRNDRDAIKITVTSSFGDETREVFTGVLCSVEAAELQIKSKKATVLPVFLARGSIDTTERVIFGLEKCFDCVIGPLILPDQELSWMSAMWAGLEVKTVEDHSQPPEAPAPRKQKNKKNPVLKKNIFARDEVKLGYVLPKDCGEADGKIHNLSVSLPAKQVKQLWSALHDEGETEFTSQELDYFHKSLGLHLNKLFSIDFDKLKLAQISLPFFQARESGVIRIEAEGHVKVVLRYLTELCQGNMLSADPTLSNGQTDNATMAISMEWAP